MFTNPYYAKTLQKKGIKNLIIVENFFIPTKKDLKKLSNSIKNCKTILDIGSGYGLLINQLAKNNPDKQFLGIDTMYTYNDFTLPIADFGNVEFRPGGIEPLISKRFHKTIKKFDCVISSWMPDRSDWRKMISILTKKCVILVLSKYFSSGTTAVYNFGMKPFKFKKTRSWDSHHSKIEIWHRC